MRLPDRMPQVRYILLNLILADIGDRPDAFRHQNMLAGGAAILRHQQFGQVVHVTERPGCADAAKPGKPFADIVDKAGLADFTVRHDVDADFRLPANHLVDGFADHRCEGGVIDFLPLLFGVNKINQLLRPWQTAGMGGQDMTAACLHRTLLPNGNAGTTYGIAPGRRLARDGRRLVLRH
jgi:hypothetical protein